ncbi:MAG: sigma 54-interacting transcriptional regulator [Blastocatellia bacterium]
MNPTLPTIVALSGLLKGRVFELTAAETFIGRGSANNVTVSDSSLSRRHCVIRRAGDDFTLTDLGSRNGVSVNGLPVQERRLAHGDQIVLGESVFLFLLHEGEAAPLANPVQLSDDDLLKGLTVRMRREEARYPDAYAHQLETALPNAARTARDLNTLLKISAAINGARNLAALESRLLALIAEAVPAETGAILLLEEGGAGEFAATFGWERQPGAGRQVSVSRTVVRQVLGEGVALLSNDVLAGADQSASLLATQTRSLLAVPLTTAGRTLGAIYLATSDPVVWFDEDHLQLVTAIAAVAAVALENLRRVEWLERENRRLREELNLDHNMIGESQRLREVYERIARVAPTDSTVLIRGESGTGKELAARAIHRNSERAASPFVAINCAALTETLLESELFGHEKGAFTGAIAQKKGRLELAQGGTLFLDELGEMPPLLQVKLLRVLQEQEYERVGGTRTLKADIRVIAATNRDLEAAIKQGGFRQDLYYRLNVITLTLPPLRERQTDIPLLAAYFTARYAAKCKRQVRGLAPAARAALCAYDWPGNVRELENAIERAVVLGADEMIQPEDLPEAVLEVASAAPAAAGLDYHEAIKEAKKQLILRACEQSGGSYVEAARLLNVNPNYLHRLIRNLDLKSLLKS